MKRNSVPQKGVSLRDFKPWKNIGIVWRSPAMPIFLCVPGMAQFLRVKVPSRVFTAKCSEPQAGSSDARVKEVV